MRAWTREVYLFVDVYIEEQVNCALPLNYLFAVPDCYARARLLNHLQVLDGNGFSRCAAECAMREFWWE